MEDTSTIIDEEILKIIKESHEKARTLLRENRDLLDKISAILLEKETLFGDEFMDIVCSKYPHLRKEEKSSKEDNDNKEVSENIIEEKSEDKEN